MADALPYYSICFFLMISTTLNSTRELKKYNAITLSLCIAILILFSGLRWQTGTDWFSYKNLFDSIKLSLDNLSNVYHFDIGYVFFNAFIRLFTDNYTYFLLVDTLLAILLIYNVIRKVAKYKLISIFVFYTGFFIGHYFGSNRRIIAIGFLLNAFYYLYQKKYATYLFCQLMAFLFHRSSLVGLCVIFMSKKNISNIKLIVVFLLSFILGITNLVVLFLNRIGKFLNIFGDFGIVTSLLFYSTHLVEEITVMHFVFATLRRSIYVLIFFIYYKKYKLEDKFLLYLLNIYFFSMCFYMILSSAGVFLTLTTYFTIVEIIIWERIFCLVKNNDKIFMLFIIFTSGILQVLNAVFFSPYSELYLPYISVFEKTNRINI